MTAGWLGDACAEDRHRAVLDEFTGGWKGELQVFALDGFLLRTFPAQRFYAWEGDTQVVVTRFFDGSSDHEVRADQRVDQGRLSSTVVRAGQPAEEYTGAIEAGKVVWTNLSRNKRDYAERLVTADGVTRLEITSSEIMRVKGVAGVVRVTGVFEREAAASDVSLSRATSDVAELAALRDRVNTLEAELARSAGEPATPSPESAEPSTPREVEITALREEAARASALAVELAQVRAELEQARHERDLAAASAQQAAERHAHSEELARREAAVNAENTGLRARIQELESSSALAEKAHREAMNRAEALNHERDELRRQLTEVQAERDQLAQRASTSTSTTTELSASDAERHALQEKLATSEAAQAEAQKQATKLEQEIAGMRLVLARANQAASETDTLRASLERAEAELADLRAKHELLESQHELLAFRARGTEEALAESRAALATAEAKIAAQQARAEAAEKQVESLQALQAQAASAQNDSEAQARLLAERETELQALRVELADAHRARSELADRVATLESAAPAAAAAGASGGETDDVRRQREEWQQELVRLQRRVTELESERNASAGSQAVLQNQLQQARQLRDDTLARFQEVVAQLNTMREERDRLARANVSLQAELRAARGTETTNVAIADGKRSPSYLERLLGASDDPVAAEKSGAKGVTVAARAEEALPPVNPTIEKYIAGLQVIGVTQSPEGDKVILNGRLFRAGDIIDEQLNVAFERVDGDALLFTDAVGHEYRRQF